MKPLTIDVHDNHAELLVGWKVISAMACDTHGMAMLILVRPAEHEKIQASTLTLPERHALFQCVIERFRNVVQRIFGIPVATVQAMVVPTPAAAPSMPPKPPGTKPQEN